MKHKLFLFFILQILIFSCNEDDNIIEDCPFELVNLSERYNDLGIHYYSIISPNSEYLVSKSNNNVILTDYSYNIIDTICKDIWGFSGNWIGDTIVRYVYNYNTDLIDYNLKTKKSVINYSPNYSIRERWGKCEIFIEDEWVLLVDNADNVYNSYLSKEKNRVVLNSGNNIAVYEISGKSISKLVEMYQYGKPVGWIDNDYFLFINDIGVGANIEDVETDFYIAKYDCSVFWKVTNSNIKEWYGSISNDKVIFNTIDLNQIFTYDIIKK